MDRELSRGFKLKRLYGDSAWAEEEVLSRVAWLRMLKGTVNEDAFTLQIRWALTQFGFNQERSLSCGCCLCAGFGVVGAYE